MASVKDTVLNYIRAEIVRDKPVEYNTRLITNGWVNSLEIVAIKSYLEAQYKINIPERMATLETFDSVENIVNMLGKLGVR